MKRHTKIHNHFGLYFASPLIDNYGYDIHLSVDNLLMKELWQPLHRSLYSQLQVPLGEQLEQG